MENIYNIETFTNANSAVIYSMYNEFVTVNTTKKASIKEKTSIFSKTIKKVEAEGELIYINDSEKNGWTKVLTYEGEFGYIKNKKVSEKNCKRTSMSKNDFSVCTSDTSNAIEVNKKQIKLENIQTFTARKKLIENIIADIISKEKFNVNINLLDINLEEEYLRRFIVELLPRLKEIGGKIILTNNHILSDSFLKQNIL